MPLKILALGGDGIGPEVVSSGLQVLEAVAGTLSLKVDITEDPVSYTHLTLPTKA